MFQLTGGDWYADKYSAKGGDTLMDGELIMDRHQDGTTTARFLVFDIVTLDAEDVGDLPLQDRVSKMYDKVRVPYRTEAERRAAEGLSPLPVSTWPHAPHPRSLLDLPLHHCASVGNV